jgi:hypothetical protein
MTERTEAGEEWEENNFILKKEGFSVDSIEYKNIRINNQQKNIS